MANAQLDHFSAYFVNLGDSVGLHKANNWDDVLVVTSLLALVYESLPGQHTGQTRAAHPAIQLDGNVGFELFEHQRREERLARSRTISLKNNGPTLSICVDFFLWKW